MFWGCGNFFLSNLKLFMHSDQVESMFTPPTGMPSESLCSYMIGRSSPFRTAHCRAASSCLSTPRANAPIRHRALLGTRRILWLLEGGEEGGGAYGIYNECLFVAGMNQWQ